MSKTKKRVLALLTDAYGGYGGIAQYNRDFTAALAAAPDIAEVVIAPRIQPAPLEKLPRGVVQHRPRFNRAAYSLRALFHALTLQPDIIYIGHLYHGPLGWMLARLTGAKLIIQLHGTEVWDTLKPWDRRALEGSDRVLTVSRDTRARLIADANLAPERVRVLANTVGAAFTPGDRAAARARFGITAAKVVLTVSRLDDREGYKGHDKVLPQIAALRQTGLDVVYLIAGTGEDRPRLERLVAELGLEAAVRFLGKVPAADLPDLYRAADLFALPSTGEGFGIVYLEALACGTPAIGLAIGGVPDALEGLPGGYLVSPEAFGAAFRAALAAPSPPAEEMADAVRARFSLPLFANQVATLIGDMLGQTAKAEPR
jgi:phosphatidyl-myo-inositol dimannoside synthase